MCSFLVVEHAFFTSFQSLSAQGAQETTPGQTLSWTVVFPSHHSPGVFPASSAPPPQPSGYNVVMEVAPTCVQLISYPRVTNPVLLSFTLSLHTHFHLQACPSHLPPWPTTHPSGMKLRCHLCWGVFPEFPDWISFLSSVLPYHPAVNDL